MTPDPDAESVAREAEQQRVVLTAHELQRVGAFALAALAGRPGAGVGSLSPQEFRAAVDHMTSHAARTAEAESTKADDGFWLKVSYGFFPNSPMNKTSRARFRAEDLAAEIQAWRTRPRLEEWPGAACALCGREAVGFYGKRDVPLAERLGYLNTTPRGYAGMALCWPCLCCFYALPYGCRLSGGPSGLVHCWDDEFTAAVAAERVTDNNQTITLGATPPSAAGSYADEVTALRHLRTFDRDLSAGLELLVFSNDNRQAFLSRYVMDQPLVGWLRRQAQGPAWAALVAAHTTPHRLGQVELARVAFRYPHHIRLRISAFMRRQFTAQRPSEQLAVLGGLYRSYLIGVEGMKPQDQQQTIQVAKNVATVITVERTTKILKQFFQAHRKHADLRRWLQATARQWLLKPPQGVTGPMVSTRQYLLLFDPDTDSWLHRELLMIAVLEYLADWKPAGAGELADDLDDDTAVALSDADSTDTDSTDGIDTDGSEADSTDLFEEGPA